jgi:hypothetical protein
VCVLLGAPKVTVRFEGELCVVSRKNRVERGVVEMGKGRRHQVLSCLVERSGGKERW